MAEYIEREVLLNALSESTEPFNVASVFRTIKRQSKADVAPVYSAHWYWSDDGYCRCSECNQKCASYEHEDAIEAKMTRFCPHCGCFMLKDET